MSLPTTFAAPNSLKQRNLGPADWKCLQAHPLLYGCYLVVLNSHMYTYCKELQKHIIKVVIMISTVYIYISNYLHEQQSASAKSLFISLRLLWRHLCPAAGWVKPRSFKPEKSGQFRAAFFVAESCRAKSYVNALYGSPTWDTVSRSVTHFIVISAPLRSE